MLVVSLLPPLFLPFLLCLLHPFFSLALILVFLSFPLLSLLRPLLFLFLPLFLLSLSYSFASSSSFSSSAPIPSVLSASSSGVPRLSYPTLSSVLPPHSGVSSLPPPPLGFPPLSLPASSLPSPSPFSAQGLVSSSASLSSWFAPSLSVPSVASTLPSSSSLPSFSSMLPPAFASSSSVPSTLSSSSLLDFATYQAHVLGLSSEYLSIARWFVCSGESDFLSFLSSHFPHLSTDVSRDFASGSSVLLSTLFCLLRSF